MAGESILVIDDNPINLKLMDVMLNLEGYRVRTAIDADAAFSILNSFHPQLILLDLQLPDVDGVAVLRRLKANPQNQSVIVLAVTAYAMKGDDKKALLAGFDGYITKPIDTEGLLKTIANYLQNVKTRTKMLNCTILLIENNEMMRTLLCKQLEAEGYSVLEAGDSKTALILAEKNNIDLILQDLMLPDVDSLELNRDLKARLRDKKIPFIALAGILTQKDDLRLIEHYFSDFLVKPIDHAYFIDIIKTYLPLTSFVNTPISSKKTVLVVDDNPMQLKLLRLQLMNAGFEVKTAINGTEALEEIKKNTPDAVVSDILMPRMDGFELCYSIRNSTKLSNLPVILVTSHYIEEKDRELGNKAAATAYITRTPEAKEIILKLQQCFDLPESSAKSITSEIFEKNHLSALDRQLERQVLVNDQLKKYCALQSTQLSLLNDVVDALINSTQIENILNNVLSIFFDAVGISKSALYFIDKSDALQGQEWMGFSDTNKTALNQFFADFQLLREMCVNKKIIHIFSESAPNNLSKQLLLDLDITSLLLVPLTSRNMCLGVFFLGSKIIKVDDAQPINFIKLIGAQIGQAIALSSAFKNIVTSEHEISKRNVELALLNDQLQKEIIKKNEMSARAEALQDQLIMSARQAGMAEIAANVIHNVGNIMNSVNTSASLLREKIKESEMLKFIGNMHQLLQEHADDFGRFICDDLKGKQFPQYLQMVIKILGDENAQLLLELNHLKKNIENIENIVLAQRSLASVSGIIVETDIPKLIDDVLNINFRADDSKKISIVRQFKKIKKVTTDKMKLFQIITHLIKNSVDALLLSTSLDKKIVISVYEKDVEHIAIQIDDTGIGIFAEALEKIFLYGFTTKKDKNGFGLHFSANTASEIGGCLSAESDGHGKGARFTLVLPYQFSQP